MTNFGSLNLYQALSKSGLGESCLLQISIVTHLVSQTYIRHGCKWNFAGRNFWFRIGSIVNEDYISVKVFISSMFTSDNQCPRIRYFGQLTYAYEHLKPWLLTVHCIILSQTCRK